MRKLSTLLLLFIGTLAAIGQRTITGSIMDAQNSKKLKDVAIGIIGTTNKVTSNKRGQFKLDINAETDTIYFMKNGYLTEYMVANKAKKVKVGLTKEIPADELSLTDSYGTQSRKANTSAVTVLKTEDFNQGAVTDIYQLLRGKVPGLVIKHDPKNPGGKPLLMLRNAANFSGNLQPLIVVDGVQNISIDTVDPNDVASVSVLRDGSAQAIYGSNAAGGVIIIQTKRGN